MATASLKRYGELMAALMRGREAAEADEEGRRVAVRELQVRKWATNPNPNPNPNPTLARC